MPEPSSNTPPPRLRSDRWSGRKTLLFIIIASAALWALIALLVHLLG